MNSPDKRLRKKTVIITLLILILLIIGYLIVNSLTLNSNQAKNSRAEENELLNQSVRRVDPTNALYSQAPTDTFYYVLQPTYLGGLKKLSLSFVANDLEQFISVLQTSKSPSQDVYSVVKRSLKSGDEEYLGQFAGMELQAILNSNSKIVIENFPLTNFADSEIILFKLP